MDTSPMPHPSSEFTDHYRAHFDFTWRNLRRLGVPATELDDAAQEVFVVLLRRRASIPPELPIRAWLFGVLRRIAWRYRRSDTRRRLLHDAVDRANLESDTETSVAERPDLLHDTREAARLVERFLAELTPIQAEVFVLAELEELSGKEIAEHLGINQNTVWSRLRLARRAFDRRFAPIRAESTRLYQRNSTPDRRHLVLSLSRRGHRPSAEDRLRVGALLGIPGFSTTPPENTAVPSTLEVAAKGSTGAPLAGMIGAALVAALTVGVGLSDRSETTARPEGRAGHVPAALVAGAGPEERESATPVEITSAMPVEPSLPPKSTPQSPLSSLPQAIARREREPRDGSASARRPDSDAPQPEPVPGNEAVAPRESALGAEYQLIAAARRAFTADPERCLALSETHRRDYPDGILAEERDGLRIAALCQLERGPEARRLAKKLAPHLDDPRTIRRFLAGCETPQR